MDIKPLPTAPAGGGQPPSANSGVREVKKSGGGALKVLIGVLLLLLLGLGGLAYASMSCVGPDLGSYIGALACKKTVTTTTNAPVNPSGVTNPNNPSANQAVTTSPLKTQPATSTTTVVSPVTTFAPSANNASATTSVIASPATATTSVTSATP